VVPTFRHFPVTKADQNGDTKVSEVGVSGLANPDTNTVQKGMPAVAMGDTKVSQKITKVIKEVAKSATTKFGQAVLDLPKMLKWVKMNLLGDLGGRLSPSMCQWHSSDA